MRRFKLVTNGGYHFAKVGQIADLVKVEDNGCFILSHPSWDIHIGRGGRNWRFMSNEVEEVTAPATPYIVMLRGKDGRLAPSSHPAEHEGVDAALGEACRLAKRHGQTFEVWQRVAVIDPPAPPKPAAPTLKPGDQVRVVSRDDQVNPWHKFRLGSIATIISDEGSRNNGECRAASLSGVAEDGSVVTQTLYSTQFKPLESL